MLRKDEVTLPERYGHALPQMSHAGFSALELMIMLGKCAEKRPQSPAAALRSVTCTFAGEGEDSQPPQQIAVVFDGNNSNGHIIVLPDDTTFDPVIADSIVAGYGGSNTPTMRTKLFKLGSFVP